MNVWGGMFLFLFHHNKIVGNIEDIVVFVGGNKKYAPNPVIVLKGEQDTSSATH